MEEIVALKGKPAAEVHKELGLELNWSAMSDVEKDHANWFLSALIASITTTSICVNVLIDVNRWKTSKPI